MPEAQAAADPFSADVFQSRMTRVTSFDSLAESAVADKPNLHANVHKPVSWMAGLPKLSRKIVEHSAREQRYPRELPERLSKSIEDALKAVAFPESNRVECRLESIVECELSAESKRLGDGGNISVHIVFEPTQAYAVLTVGGAFVRSVTDNIFGPSRYDTSNRLSPIETAIAEFLAAKIVAQINDGLGDEFFLIGGSYAEHQEIFREHETGAKARLEIQDDGLSKGFYILISQSFLSGMENAGILFDGDPAARSISHVLQAIPSVRLRAQLGSTKLDAATLSFLESGDVVIVDEPAIKWNHGSPRGDVVILVGAGRNFVLNGDVSNSLFSIKEISSRQAVNNQDTARFIMEDKGTATVELEETRPEVETDIVDDARQTDEISESLGNVQVRLRVELAGNKISLRELDSLRVGQVIDLGRGPTDTVDLVTDGSDETVAVGELVDLEGRLGVRLTKVFL
jgi:flagellar motor switch/type III secretory pathway protein FliN